MSKGNTIQCSDFLSNELKGKIKQTRNYIIQLTGEYKRGNDRGNNKR
jgi:hypothetical protein